MGNNQASGRDSLGKMVRRLTDPSHLGAVVGRTAKTLREQGAEQMWRDVRFRVGLAMHKDFWQHYADIPLKRELKAQRAENLQGPCISIVVPLYNTPARYFKQMTGSVRKQTYTNWQLVMMDASDAAHAEVSAKAAALAQKDARFVYRKIENGGIAANTTKGFAVATGAYLTLLDHDDVIYPNALYDVVRSIQSTGADFLYSDEIVLSDDFKQLGGYHLSPILRPITCAGSTTSPIWRCSAASCWTRRVPTKARNMTAHRITI